MVGVEKKGIRERKGGNSGSQTDEEGVEVGNKNDGTLVGDGVLVRDGGEGSPLLEVEGNIGIWEVTVSLVVGTGAHDDPAEHGVASVPDFGLDGRSPSPLGELGVFVAPVLYGIVEDRAGNAGGAGPGDGEGG